MKSILFAVGALLVPVAGAQAAAPAVDEMLAESLEGRAEFDTVVEDGKLLSVVGLFDLGISAEDAEVGAIEEAVASYFTRHRESYGLNEGYSSNSLQVTELHSVGSDRLVVHLWQYTADGFRFLDSELTVVLWLDGKVEAIHGPVRGSVRSEVAAQSIDAVLAAAGELPDFLAPTATQLVSSVISRGVYTRADSDVPAVEWGYDPHLPGYVWDITSTDQMERVRLRGDDLSMTKRSQLIDHFNVDTTQCSIRHFDWPRDANSRVTAYGNNNQTSGTRFGADVRCTGDYYAPPWGPDWHLRFETPGYTHHLGRVQDDDAAQVWVDDPNYIGAPQFSGTGTSAMEQQTAYSEAYAMRVGVWNNSWTQFTPDSQHNVQITLDTNGNSGFLGFNTDIYLNAADTNARLVNVIRHEYGHYVVFSYGDVSDNCNTTDHGDAIDETIADAFAMVGIRDDARILPNYNTNFNLGQFGTFVPPHTTLAPPVVNSGVCVPCTTNAQCTRNGVDSCFTAQGACDTHFNGLAFEQAIWELLYNRNCNTVACPSSTTGNGNEIWIGATPGTVSTKVGRGLAFAMKTLGPNITFGQIITAMRTQWIADADTATGNRARAVFTHHGL